jgi:hypothetical protein
MSLRDVLAACSGVRDVTGLIELLDVDERVRDIVFL